MMHHSVFINGNIVDYDDYEISKYYLTMYRKYEEVYKARIDKIYEIKIYTNYGYSSHHSKKYDFSLWIKNNDGDYEEFARAKSNSPRYIYNKLVKCQYDEKGKIIPAFKDRIYINNYNNKQSYCLFVSNGNLEWHED